MSMIGGLAERLEVVDPGFVRTRRGTRAVCATVSAWATMAVVTTAFDVSDPLRITLFAAGAAFEGALLAPDPRPADRVRTLGWAVMVCAVAVVSTVHLTLIADWLAAVLLVLLMFSSYALRAWSPRVASLALIGAITVYITGGGHITVGRIGWFVLAAAIGFGWLALWENVILPDDPLRALRRSVHAFSRRTADVADGVAAVLDDVRHGTSPERVRKAMHASLRHVRSCRDAIERQSPGAVATGMNTVGADQLRVALHSAHKGLQDIAVRSDAPDWTRALPEEFSSSISATLRSLATSLRTDDGQSRATAARAAAELRTRVHEDLAGAVQPGTLLGALTLLDGAEVVVQSVAQADDVVARQPAASSADTGEDPKPSAAQGLSPTMALAIQAVTAAIAAGLFATLVGNEQSLVVAWTAFVVIAGSAGLSRRRAWVRIPATTLGAVGGVLIAATVPDTLGWTIAVVAVGVFFTIVTAPVSYPAMVFWMSIAFVPLFASEGRYLDLIWDKSVAALIGGTVAAVVTLTVVPIRSSREVRPAVLDYLAAIDAALAAHLPDADTSVAAADAALDQAHAALSAKVEAAATETSVFAQPEHVRDEQIDGVDAVHEAYVRLTPLLSDSARLLHGWTDARVEIGIANVRAAVSRADAAARGAPTSETEPAPVAVAAAGLGLSDSLQRVDDLSAALGRLTALL